jgi:type I restriction enzyme S subunit
MFASTKTAWSIWKLKHVARVRSSNVDKNTEPAEIPIRLCNYTDVYYHEKLTNGLALMEATATPDEIQRFAVRPGDVLLTKDSEVWDDIGVPALVAERIDDGVCGYHLAHVRPNSKLVTGAFLARVLAARGIREQFHVEANGITRYGLTLASIGSVRIPVPPLGIQTAITEFLDAETAKIDAIIGPRGAARLTQGDASGTVVGRTISLLQEYRTALISAAVTGQVEVQSAA